MPLCVLFGPPHAFDPFAERVYRPCEITFVLVSSVSREPFYGVSECAAIAPVSAVSILAGKQPFEYTDSPRQARPLLIIHS